MEFLRALESADYGEVGIDYLESLEAQNKVPPAIKDSYDLQMAIFIKDSVREAYNPTEAEQREAKYKAMAQKFIADHPDSPDAARAKALLGEAANENAMTLLAEAKLNPDKTEAAKQMEEARKAFQEAKSGLAATVASYQTKYEALEAKGDKGGRTNKQKQAVLDAIADAKLDWYEVRMSLAMADYYIAQTYLDHKAGPRKEALKAAGKAFDAIYQENRGVLTILGVLSLYAHVWDGKCADEMGDEVKAQDIYDEVSAMEPEGSSDARAKPSGIEPLLSQNANFNMLITLRKKGAEAYLDDAGAWLKQWDFGGPGNPDSDLKKAYRKTDGYQAIALQFAKLNLEKAKKATGPEATKLSDAARKRLKEIVKVKSESRLEAMRLYKEFFEGKSEEGGAGGDVANIKDFNEAALSADEAANNGSWEAALKLYELRPRTGRRSQAGRDSQGEGRQEKAGRGHEDRPRQGQLHGGALAIEESEVRRSL